MMMSATALCVFLLASAIAIFAAEQAHGRSRAKVASRPDMTAPGSAESSPVAATRSTPSACAGQGETSGEVASVPDGRSLRLVDGREVRLAGIEIPGWRPKSQPEPDSAATADAVPSRTATTAEGSAVQALSDQPAPRQADLARPEPDGPQTAADSQAVLEDLVLHRQIIVRTASPSPDRYGRVVGFVFLAGSESFIQDELLENGFALVSPAPFAPACRLHLREAEHTARAARLGLWSDPYYGVMSADDPADILALQGHFALVGGQVASVHESGGLVYVNFGRRWSEDFTVTISKRNERLFARAGLVPDKLAGRRIEVRGFIEQRGGPTIEAGSPEQIEIVEGN
jgi:endonuclease YncB( thermonuclease family)